MLDFSDDGHISIELIDAGDNFWAVLGEAIPVDEGLIANKGKDLIEILFESLDLDFGHVERFTDTNFNCI